MTNDKNNPKTLEDAIQAVRRDEAPEAEMRAASDRVWSKLSGQAPNNVSTKIEGCADIQALLPMLGTPELSVEREMIVEDHLRDCIACRKIQHMELSRIPAKWAPQTTDVVGGNFWDVRRMAVAAMLFFTLGVSVLVANYFYAPLPGNRATVQAVTGPVYLIASNSEQPLLPGRELNEGDVIRTGYGSHAVVKLFDGSVVEVNERAEFSVTARRRATTIHLGRGNIIVQAAKQHNGHLYVATNACKVSVVGTVFSVDSGMMGSRVSVIEGEVHVDDNGTESVLHSGDQVATNAAMGEVPIENEIAWSENREQHLALLAEFSKLQKKLEGVTTPGLRYNSAILPVAPEQTLIYASIPNYGEALAEANRLFQDQLRDSDVLRQWWQSNGLGKEEAKFQEMIQRIHTLSKYLGDEVVVMLVPAGNGKGPAMIVASQVTRPGVKDFLQAELAGSAITAEQKQKITVIDETGSAAGVAPGNIIIMAGSDLLVASSDGQALQNFLNRRAEGNTGFAASSFGQAISASYQEGAGLLFAADLEKMIVFDSLRARRAGTQPNTSSAFQKSGFAQARHLVVKRREQDGQVDNRAAMTFSGQRTGIASWLAAPSGIGSLDFVSPDAVVAAAATMKSPAAMVDDIYAMIQGGGGNVDGERAKFQSEMKFDLRDELAATLGGDFAVALDGPVLPTPAWKFIVEVNNQTKLQSTLQLIVQDINDKAALHNQPGVTLQQTDEDSRSFYMLKSANPVNPMELHYTFASGYLVAAPSHALLLKALKVRESGVSLSRSNGFAALLPKDQHTNASGIMYQNLASVAGAIGDQLTGSQAQSLQTIVSNARPSLLCVYGDTDRIEIATTSRLFGFDVNNFALSQLLPKSFGTQRGTNP
ncbi:MAG: putative FecR [Acidobacteriales bacterium]|nr:putative FecR [Terriglobales bacterium]